MTLAEATAAWFCADLIAGAVHWAEDRYGNPEWPIVGKHVIRPNIVHHMSPRAFLSQGYWQRNWTTLAPALLVAAVAAWLGFWWLATVAAFLSQANEIHAWAHQRCSRPIRGLQLLGVLHSPEQHASHHVRPYDRNFCPMSDISNWVLTAIGFWPAVEGALARVGCNVRPDRVSE